MENLPNLLRCTNKKTLDKREGAKQRKQKMFAGTRYNEVRSQLGK